MLLKQSFKMIDNPSDNSSHNFTQVQVKPSIQVLFPPEFEKHSRYRYFPNIEIEFPIILGLEMSRSYAQLALHNYF